MPVWFSELHTTNFLQKLWQDIYGFTYPASSFFVLTSVFMVPLFSFLYQSVYHTGWMGKLKTSFYHEILQQQQKNNNQKLLIVYCIAPTLVELLIQTLTPLGTNVIFCLLYFQLKNRIMH